MNFLTIINLLLKFVSLPLQTASNSVHITDALNLTTHF